jgi:hypothetical protein
VDQIWILMQGGIRKTKAENAVIMTRAASEELTCKAVFEDMVQDVSVTVAEARMYRPPPLYCRRTKTRRKTSSWERAANKRGCKRRRRLTVQK